MPTIGGGEGKTVSKITLPNACRWGLQGCQDECELGGHGLGQTSEKRTVG